MNQPIDLRAILFCQPREQLHENDEIYDIDNYERDLTPEEEDALTAQQAEERQPYEDAAARARDAFFGLETMEETAAETG